MSIGVVLIGFLGILEPSLMKPLAPQIPTLLGIIMFGMGMSLKPEDFRNVFRQPKNVALGALLQFIIMPALAFVLIQLFRLPPAVAIGIVLVGCCPGGTASNVITYLARGDVALSVSMTMVSTLLAPLVTPFLVWLIAGTWVNISFVSMMISIMKMVLMPLLLGVVMNTFFPRQVTRVIGIMPLLSALVIILTVGCVVSLSGRAIVDNGLMILAAVICHNLFGMFLGGLCARKLGLTPAQCRAMTIEVGMQNSGLASTLALMYFTAAGGIAGAIFSVWHNVSGSLYASYCIGKEEEQQAPVNTLEKAK